MEKDDNTMLSTFGFPDSNCCCCKELQTIFMKSSLYHQSVMKTLHFYFFLLFSIQTVDGKMRPRSEVCGSYFSWNEDMKEVKLLNDCDILKEQLKLADAVERITNKFMCITNIELNIAGVQMQRWKNVAGQGLTGRAVTFKNLLHEQNRHRQARVIVTAQNPNAQSTDFEIQFDIDSSNCQGIIEQSNNSDEEARKKLLDHEKEKSEPENYVLDNTNLIVITVLPFSLLLLIIILTIVCLKRRCCMKRIPMKEEVNDTYGTYAMGWDGEGEYGDGDKVYVTDTNYYYAAS